MLLLNDLLFEDVQFCVLLLLDTVSTGECRLLFNAIGGTCRVSFSVVAE